MAITLENLRIVPYTQKDTYKPIWGDTLNFAFLLPSAHREGDKYCFGCDWERVVYPPMRPLCAYTEDYSISTTDAGQIISITLVFNTARFRDWVCGLKKPTPITLQLVRIRDEVQDTLLLDDILALPSVVDGENIVCPGDPIKDLLDEKLDKPEEDGHAGQYLALGADGKTVWKTNGGGGGGDTQADWDESDSDSPAYIRNKPTIPPPQVQADWDESDSDSPAYIQNKPDIPAPPIVASTAPTTSTAGAVGQLYVDTATSKTYHCTAVTTDESDPQNPVTTYTWVDDINANGGILNNGLFYKTTNNGKGYQFLLQAESVGVNLILSNYNGIRLGGDPPAVMPISYSNCNLFAGFGFAFEGDYLYYISNNLVFGNYMNICKNRKQMLMMGSYNVGRTQAQRIISRGTASNARWNIEELSDNGDHYITGGHQQGIIVIPASTSAYTLAEGCFEHIPSSAPTYTLPAIMPVIVVDGWAFKRDTSLDGTGYFGWNTDYTKRYAASATPAVGDNTYTNTALTQGAKAVTAIDRRTHECILTVRFSASALSCAFQDAAGNVIAPLPLAGTIADGSVVCYRCTWEELLGRWVIMPVMLGTYSAGV